MKFSRSVPNLSLFVTLFIAFILSYSIALRFTDFLFLARQHKILLLAGLWLVFALLGLFFIIPAVRHLLKDTARPVLFKFLYLSLFISIVLMGFFYNLPPFPRLVNLEIKPVNAVPAQSNGGGVTLSSITSSLAMSKRQYPINLSELEPGNGWKLAGEKLIFSPPDGPSGSVFYSGYVGGALTLEFQVGPDQGEVEVIADGESKLLHLNQSTDGEIEYAITLPQKWRNADGLRKAILALGFLTDGLALLTITALALLAFYHLIFHRRLRMRGVLALALVIVLSSGVLLLSNKVQARVEFQDPSIELSVRELIDQPEGPIYSNQLLTIIELDLSGKNIEDLGGIDALRNLRVLNLSNNHVRDYAPLAALQKLQELDLSNNRLHSINSFPMMRSLQRLNLRQNRLTSISALVNSYNLRTLDLSRNRITDISPLQQLLKLEELNLRENRITDIAALSHLKRLTYLNLHSNSAITDISALRDLTGLQTLILRNIPIGDQIGVVENLVNLVELNVRNCAITDFSNIAALIEKGALQDDPNRGVRAGLNILDNPVPTSAEVYEAMLPYWDNITFRYPLILPYEPRVSAPEFSQQSGFYEDEFLLTLSTLEADGRILYTLDGSEPSLNPQLLPWKSTEDYSAPILVRDRSADPNQYAHIETSKLSDYQPLDDIAKATVVRAMVVDEEGQRSQVITHTYFVGDDLSHKYTFPVVSLTSSPEGLFGDAKGIFVPGDSYQEVNDEDPKWNPANYTQRGAKWERPAYLQLFDQRGELVLEQAIGIRTHGGASRAFQQKSIRLYAGDYYGDQGLLEYNFFPALDHRMNEREVDTFETLVLRTGGGGDWQETIIRDVLLPDLLKDTNLDIQGYYPVVVFLDGEYWGIYNLRTRYDAYYFYAYYGIDADDLIVCEQGQNLLYLGEPGDEELYDQMLQVIDEDFYGSRYKTVNTLADPAAYARIASMMDIENYLDYTISGIYTNKLDWPLSNIMYWRKKTVDSQPSGELEYGHDGKWRWMVNDFDWSYNDPYGLTLQRVTTEGKESTYLFRSLLQNETFKQQFINRFADLLNSTFTEERVLEKVDEFEALYLPEMEEHIQRWGEPGGSVENWQANVDVIRQFARLRPDIQRQQLVEYFGLTGTARLTISADQDQGYVRVNSIELKQDSPGVTDSENWSGIYFKGVLVTLTAVPREGYRFSHWEGLTEGQAGEPEIVLDLSSDLTLTAVFTR